MNDKSLRVLEFNKIIERLVSFAVSEPGKQFASALKPYIKINEVKAALAETDDAAAFIARRGSSPMSDISDIRPSLKRIEIGGCLSFSELIHICDVLKLCRRLKDYSNTASEDGMFELGANVISSMITALYSNKRLEERISGCILSEDEMADDASSELFSIRKQIRDRQNSIKEKLNSLMFSHAKYMQDTVVTIRGDRYVVPVKIEFRQHIPGLVHDTSASGQTLFVEPMAVVEANNKIKELRGKEQAEIERILYMLSAEVDVIKDELVQNTSLLASLDFAFAKGRLSLDLRAVSPKLNEEHKINIINGRHPLIEKNVVVPINFWIGEDFDSLIVTGPNTGGKTVTLKTVGLFTLMTQSGLHIPADVGTEMSIFQSIYADIGDEQSIEQSLSTFSSHMKNIVEILHSADDMSMVLFDELGAGTDPTEGAALAMAILECLHQKGCTSVATTHYSELKVYAVSTPGFENASCEFNVETLRPTYKLLIGVPGKSNAFAISQRLGLDNAIISRSKEFLTAEDLKFEDLLLNIEKNREEAERDRAESNRLKAETERLKEDAERRERKLLAEKEAYIKKAKEEAMKIIDKAKAEADVLVSEMRKLSFAQKNSVELKEAEILKRELDVKVRKSQSELSDNPLTQKNSMYNEEERKNLLNKLKEGTKVRILSLGHEGVVLREPDKDGNVFVQAGLMKVSVHISNLEPFKEKKNESKNAGYKGGSVDKMKNMSTEINVRGCNVDEATLILDKYIDDAVSARFSPISVIHGKGTGALRSGIHSYLKSHKYVKSFRLGSLGEGDTGVTIIEIKI